MAALKRYRVLLSEREPEYIDAHDFDDKNDRVRFIRNGNVVAVFFVADIAGFVVEDDGEDD